MPTTILRGLVLIFALSCSAFAGVEDLRQVMPNGRERPYLYFTKQDLSVMLERVRTQPRARMVYEWLLKECNRLLDVPVSHEVPPRYRGISPYFEGQDSFGKYRDELAKSAYYLAFAYQLTGRNAYAEKSYAFAEPLAQLDSWVDTWDRFPWLYWMGKPYGAKWNDNKDNEIVYSYELGASLVSKQLAAIYDWLYPALNTYQRKMLANALLENAILRVRGNYDYHWWAHAWRTNWLPVCFSGLGIAALALYSDDPQLLDVVEETRVRMNRFFDEAIGVDGGYQEGLGYWKYGIENAVLFAAALKNVSGGKVNMFDHPRLRTTVQFPMYTFTAPRGGIAFGDGREPLQGNWELYNKFASEFNDPQSAWLGQFFHDFDPSQPEELGLFSIIWPEANVAPALPDASKAKSIHFRTIDWVVMRASWENSDYPVLAAKGGILDDPHHGHLDAGQFAIKYRGEWYVKELGYMSPYGLGYWDYRRRFKDYFHANSLGHNVVFVNGEPQEYGRQYFGKVADFQTSESQDYALIDLSKAYPGKELKGWRRHIIFEKPYCFILLDEVTSASGAEVVSRIHPGVSCTLKGDYAFFRGASGTMAMLPLFPKSFVLKQDQHPFLAEQRDAQFSWVPYYDMIIKASGVKTYIVNVFVPVQDEEEARQALRTGVVTADGTTLRCAFIYRGKKYSRSFTVSGGIAQ